jgi:acyl carrier protein
MTRTEIYDKVKDVLAESLAVDDDEITPEATLTRDLGAESIDFLDIGFQLEQAFGFKIQQGELFPDNVTQDPDYVQGGQVTAKGLAALEARLPHADFSRLREDPSVAKVAEIFTVDALVNFVERKLAST